MINDDKNYDNVVYLWNPKHNYKDCYWNNDSLVLYNKD